MTLFCLLTPNTILCRFASMTGIISTIPSQNVWNHWGLTWRAAAQGWLYLHRRADLERLIQWATRKRLLGPRMHYRMLRMDTEQRLLQHQFRYPRLTWWLRFFFALSAMLLPSQHYHRKGAASKYKLRNYSLNWRPSEKRVLSY